ncbi:serine hydrolase [Alcaligenes endophyticus]|uniref:Serine hydrolase n=1 Tax=Alcaligenes endophyticus TaxID=1929088 RepID=A0ABT8EIL8_9BURK|nr:serine hydrolase [Alcaligenes endophyticus]MCX5592403.1 serine hydrolase [Alcaligenes endophyticus]MDN4121128.1 serine hydrolase [Alcaligenes endophyticus]
MIFLKKVNVSSIIPVLVLSCSPLAAQTVAIDVQTVPNMDAVAIPSGSREQAVEALPAIIDSVMKRSQVPGMAVGVVLNGKTVFAQGYGKRELGKPEPVTAQTVFLTASVSKSLSSTVAAIEVGKGHLAWDDAVTRYLPDFTLRDHYVTQHATIADFLAHRSGLPGTAGDDLETLGYTRDQVLARLRLLPLYSFRTSYHYANFSATIGAEAVAAAAKKPFEDLAREELFLPLGMNATSYYYHDYEAQDNRASLHVYEQGKFQPRGQRNADAQAPAGGASSNVIDLAEWLKLLLANGQYQGKRLMPTEALLPVLSPQAFSAPPFELNARPGFYGYGFNVSVETGGRPAMGHSGAFLLGAGTSFKIIPSAGLGIVVLTNGAPVGAAEAVVAQFTDIALYGKTTRDWYATYHQAMQGFFAPQADLSAQQRPASPSPAQSLQHYVGNYENAYFGPAQIRESGSGMTLVLGPKGMSFKLSHWDGATFVFTPPGEAELVASQASIAFQGEKDQPATRFVIKTYDENGLGTWTRQ